jgi:CheY-like chemotaxis protein
MKTPPKHILLIDDEPGVREVCRLMLGIDGHAVTEAKNGIEGLALFAGDRFDLVMIDFSMPGMNGGELAVKLKQLAPSLPILMITGYARELTVSLNPVDAILPKPFSPSELRQVLAQLLSIPLQPYGKR